MIPLPSVRTDYEEPAEAWDDINELAAELCGTSENRLEETKMALGFQEKAEQKRQTCLE